ncbi:MAG: hypothetical protein KDD53_00795 [Bdellovibrionales bacterium]|nr:hypothetical protein [Bdellovibrionales bacterium]
MEQAQGSMLSTISRFSRDFIHRLRTPLSVIATEVAYLRQVAPELDLDRLERKVTELNSILKVGSAIGDPSLKITPIPLSELYSNLSALVDITNIDCSPNLIINLDLPRFNFAIKTLSTLTKEPIQLSVENSSYLRIVIGDSKAVAHEASTQGGLAATLETFSKNHSFEFQIAQAILAEHGASLKYTLSPCTSLEVTIPVEARVSIASDNSGSESLAREVG